MSQIYIFEGRTNDIYFEGRNNLEVGGPAQTTNNYRIPNVGAHHAALSMHVDHMHVDHGSSCRSVTQFRDRANPYVPNPYD